MTLGLTRRVKRLVRRAEKQKVQIPPRKVAVQSYTIDTNGEITLTGYSRIRYIDIDTFGGAASDNLDTINGGREGDILICRATNATRTVVFKDGTGNMFLSGDFSADTSQDTIMLVGTPTGWLQVSSSNNS